MTRAEQKSVIERVFAELHDKYPFPDLVKKMEQTVNEKLRAGVYSRFDTPQSFAVELTQDLQGASNDRHVFISYTDESLKAEPLHHIDSLYAPPEQMKEIEERARPENYGTSEVRILKGNVGYIKVENLMPLEFAADVYAAVMRYVANTDALVFDLRSCGGAQSPDDIPFLAGYLFAHPTHLTNLFVGGTATPQQLWSLASVPGPKYLDKPVYMLTSRSTFSGCEAFAYEMQALKRATVVGEVTGGGGNPNTMFPIAEHLVFSTPFARVENPVTGTNWNEKGVTPDLATTRIEALHQAHLAALKAVQAKASRRRDLYAQWIEELNSEAPKVVNVGFQLAGHQDAKGVAVIGGFNDFTGWANPMQRVNGKWIASVPVQPGRYAYLFLVDGHPVLDPANSAVSRDKRTNFVTVQPTASDCQR